MSSTTVKEAGNATEVRDVGEDLGFLLYPMAIYTPRISGGPESEGRFGVTWRFVEAFFYGAQPETTNEKPETAVTV